MMNISEQGIAVCYWYQQEKTELMIKKTINLKQLNCKKNSLAKPCHLSTPAKFTSPERIKLTLQQGCNVMEEPLEKRISAMEKALDTESQRMSPEEE